MNILITAGPTREKIDPVRFMSNYSTGSFGYAIAYEARRRGHRVTLISGPTALPKPKGVHYICVESAIDMEKAVAKEFPKCDCLIMAAAVSDWRVKSMAGDKIKRRQGGRRLELVENPDIIREMGKRKGRKTLVGFALETRNLEKNAAKKLREKNLDLVVANKLSSESTVFGDKPVSVFVLDRFGRRANICRKSKKVLAKIILDKALNLNL